MNEKSADEQIRDLMEERFGWTSLGILDEMPSDTSQPNIHNSKREFLLERDTIQKIVNCLDEIGNLTVCREHDTNLERAEMLRRIADDVDGYRDELLQTVEVISAQDLALKNIIDSGFHSGSLLVMAYLRYVYRARLIDLKEQEEEFWNLPHRPPNYYARTIALRLAKFYAVETNEKPTFGISSDGPHPSTDFGRLLEQVFRILEVSGNVRAPAEWAIRQITDEDLSPRPIAMGGGLFGSPRFFHAADEETVLNSGD